MYGLDKLKKAGLGQMGGEMGGIEIAIKFCPKKHEGMGREALDDMEEEDEDEMDTMDKPSTGSMEKSSTVVAFSPKMKQGKTPFMPKGKGV